MFDPSTEEIDAHITSAKVEVGNKTAQFTLENMVAKMKPDPLTGDLSEIDIPEYQRPFVWGKAAQSKFIESLLLELPIPYIFLAQRKTDGRLEVIDGSQRLRTMKAFLENQLVLSNLEKLNMLNGLRYDGLPKARQRDLRNVPIHAVLFSAHADDSVRFDVFQRINAEGTKLSDAQIRKGAYKGPFYDLVLKLADRERFQQMAALRSRKDDSGERAELVLRFFAYSDRYQLFQHDVARFLNEFVKEQNSDGRLDLAAMERAFESMLDYVESKYPYGFRKGPTSNEIPRVRFEAIAVGTHLALTSGRLDPAPSFEWLASDKFAELTRTDASNSNPRLRARIEFVRDRLTR
jgi:hypothetical protein